MTQNTSRDTAPRGSGVMTRRRWARSLVGVAGAPALAACGAFGGGSAPGPTLSGPVTLVYMSNLPDTGPEGVARLELLDEFNRTNTLKITVDLANGKATTDNDKIKTMAASGAPPDLYYVSQRFTAEFYTRAMTIDVDTELNREKDWAKQRADLFPAMLDSSLWAGKLVGVPGYTNNQAIIYNLGLLQQAGVALPKQGWTWDDFKAIGTRFVRPDIIPYSNDWGTWSIYLRTTGGAIISKDFRKMQVDTPEMLQVMEHFLDLLKSKVMQMSADGKSGLNETYRNAKNDTVFESQGPYRMPVLRQNKAPDFGVIHIPVHPQKKQVAANNGGHNMVIFKQIAPEKRYAAALVAKWMNAPHAQALMCIKATSIPVSKAAMDSKELQDYLKTDLQFKAFVDLAPNGWRFPTLPSLDKIMVAINGGVGAIMRQEIGAKAALTRTQQEAQTALDDDVRLMN